jgi:hypothetical protein
MAQTTKTTNLRLSAGFLTVARAGTEKNPRETFEKHNFDKQF